MLNRKKNIDLLVSHLWKLGYTIIKRKLGTYLSEPPNINGYEIDLVAKIRRQYAMGICIEKNELHDAKFLQKLSYLASRKTKTGNKDVLLFISFPVEIYKMVKDLVSSLDDPIKRNIYLVPMYEMVQNDLFNTSYDKVSLRNVERVH
ncbi:MAG: hypothetical protein GW805_11465 [Ignavibacteria bacterium]|nr:hypothetical protein [Ignavibacteria bacterium]NCS81736.1 hypothetical protein [Ignavibacteria bacterium]